MMKFLIVAAIVVVAVSARVPINEDLCADCTTLFTDVKSRLANPDTALAIEAQINKYSCDLFLVGKETCKSTVKKVVGGLFGFIANMINPETICALLQYCQPTPPTPPPQHVDDSVQLLRRFMALVTKSNDEPDLCADCTNLFTDMKTKLTDPAFAEGIVASLDKYSCDLIPIGMIKEGCTSITKTLVAQGLQTVGGLIDPTMICSMLQYCSAPTPPPMLLHPEHIEFLDKLFGFYAKAQAGDVDLCGDCKTLFTDMKARISSPDFANGISAQISKYSCDLLPIGKETCTAAVSTFVGSALSFMAGLIEPEQLCTLVGYCQPTPPVLHESTLFFTPFVTEPTVTDVDLCTDCTTLFSDVQTRLTNAQTIAAITGGIEKFTCDLMPAFKSTCNTVVSNSVSSILGFMANLIDPDMICKMLTYCSE